MKMYHSAFCSDVLFLTWGDLFRLMWRGKIKHTAGALIVTLGNETPKELNAHFDAEWQRLHPSPSVQPVVKNSSAI